MKIRFVFDISDCFFFVKVQIKCDLRVLQQFSFTLQQDFELPAAYRQLDVLSSVRDMLMKHHLFSWDL